VQVTAWNRGAAEAELALLPQAWFRNTWSWKESPSKPKPTMTYVPEKQRIELTHHSLGNFHLYVDETIPPVEVIFCENETNDLRVSTGGALSPYKEPAPRDKEEALMAVGDFRCLEPNAWFGLWRRFGGNLGPEPAKREQETGLDQGFPHHLSGGKGPFKDGFHDYVIRGDKAAVSSSSGTKAGLLTRHKVAAGSHVSFRLRLTCADKSFPQGAFRDFDNTFQSRREEADRFYGLVQEDITDSERRLIHRQALAGMVWTKQLYYYDIRTWLSGDEGRGRPPSRGGRNEDWDHLYNADVISMPDKWEYPWYATWDLAFHCLPLALVDAQFAKEQLRLITLERFMHPNGQFPAYEWNFNDVNPPVHAWAVWRVFQMDRKNRADDGDLSFLEELFHKLMLNFTWWVNRKDAEGRNIFQGGFLGLDNIGVVDRSQPFPNGGMINQSDGTSWMAFYSLTLMRMALELALHNPVYESIACKFLEHFLHIARAMTRLADNAEHGLWDPVDEFYYDVLANPDGSREPIKLRSIVGLIPLFAVEVLEPDMLKKLPRFASQTQWLFDNRPDLACLVSRFVEPGRGERRLLSLLRGYRMRALLKRMLDPMEFLSDYGVRGLSKYHDQNPYAFGDGPPLRYAPAEATVIIMGGNSNWRGPVWFPINYLLIESLQKFHQYYGDDYLVECPTGSGNKMSILKIADELSERLIKIFLKAEDGHRPGMRLHPKMKEEHFDQNLLFYEYFHGDNGRGVGSSHQTGWTGLIAKLIQVRGREDAHES